MSAGPRAEQLTVERYAVIAAEVAVYKDRPLGEVLAPHGLSEGAWQAAVTEWTKRLVDEIKARAGSGLPIEERFPLSATYAKEYAQAVKEARRAQSASREVEAVPDDETTRRIPPDRPRDEPFSVLSASNRAARRSGS